MKYINDIHSLISQFLSTKELIQLLSINKEYNKKIRKGIYWKRLMWENINCDPQEDGYKIYKSNTIKCRICTNFFQKRNLPHSKDGFTFFGERNYCINCLLDFLRFRY